MRGKKTKMKGDFVGIYCNGKGRRQAVKYSRNEDKGKERMFQKERPSSIRASPI